MITENMTMGNLILAAGTDGECDDNYLLRPVRAKRK